MAKKRNFTVRVFTDYTVEAESEEQARELYDAAVDPEVGYPKWDVTSDGIDVTPEHTENFYDPRWVEAINGVLADRESDLRITDIDEHDFDRYLGPMIDRIEIDHPEGGGGRVS
jgi:hypothetical protein